ncbi:Omp28-related outer membrane protein [Bacteroidota bacterium]
MKTYKLLAIFFIVALAFAACDREDEPYLEYQGSINPDDTTVMIRKILIEKFTGHRCVNCPQGNIIANNIHNLYGSQIVIVAIHAGFDSEPAGIPFDADFRTTAGNELDSYFQVPFYPTGMVNRTEYSGETVMFINKWESATNELINLPPEANIKFTSVYDAGTRKVNIEGQVEFLADLQGKYNLCVFILENGIISPQKNNDPNIGPSPDWIDYVHNHMLRTTDQHGTWGVEITAIGGSNGDTFDFSSNASLAADWDEANIEIVAFLINRDTEVVVQAEAKDM